MPDPDSFVERTERERFIVGGGSGEAVIGFQGI